MRIPVFLVIAVLVFGISSAWADTITTFTPSQVGFLLSDQPTTNAAPGLEQIGVYHFDDLEYVSYLQFDLSGFTGPRDITDKTLTMTWASVSQFFGTPVPINVYLANSDAWTTDSITWNNQPGFTTQLSSILFNPDNPAEPFTRTWTLTGLNIQKAINAGALSLAVAIPINTLATGITFKLPSPNEPTLSLTIRQSIPEPSTWILFGIGFTGVAWLRRACKSA